MKKILLSIAFALMGFASTFAAKAYPGPITVMQSDGTELTVYLHGDENFNWITTEDGALLTQVGKSYYIAETTSTGALKATKFLAHNVANRSNVEQQAAAKQNISLFLNQANKAVATNAKATRGIGTPSIPYFQHNKVNGKNPKALVILVEFADSTFKSGDKANNIFDYYLNAQGDTPKPNELDEIYNIPTKYPNLFGQYVNYGSVNQYFYNMSNGVFCPEFDVVGPFKLPKKSNYYGEGENDRPQELMQDACAAAHQAGIDFSQYDQNNDGYVDLVYLIYAGYGASVSGITEHIWPKSGTLRTPLQYNGKTISRYGINNELNVTPSFSTKRGGYLLNGIGLFCHEFSHCLGLPDLYATSTAGKQDNHNLENWDLMDGGEYLNEGYCPAPYSPWELDVMGWQTPIVLNNAQQVEINSFETSKQSYKIEGENGEYLLLHNVQLEGWNQYMPSHGMLVYRIDYPSKEVNTMDYPNNKTNPGITIVPADGILKCSDNVINSDNPNGLYSQEEYLADMLTDTYPTTYKKNGQDVFVNQILSVKLNNSTLEKPIYNIKEENGVITFDYLKDFSTGIDSPIANNEIEKDAKIYTLDGRYLGTDASQLTKGVYIIGKKKVVIK